MGMKDQVPGTWGFGGFACKGLFERNNTVKKDLINKKI
jgi:hypothetical protein